jgi:hypothetical protein
MPSPSRGANRGGDCTAGGNPLAPPVAMPRCCDEDISSTLPRRAVPEGQSTTATAVGGEAGGTHAGTDSVVVGDRAKQLIHCSAGKSAGGDTSEIHLERIAAALQDLVDVGRRIASRVAPEPPDVVGTPYIANRLACTTVWVTDMARNGQIPKNCIVPGTGNGKPWKFYRRGTDEWLDRR